MTTAANDTIIKNCLFLKETYNSNNGYQVALYKDLDEGGYLTAVGSSLPTVNEIVYKLQGKLVVHKKYGTQLKVLSYEEILPKKPEKIKKFLVNAGIKHIGPSTAEKIVSKFGEKTYYVIENTPELLSTIPFISKKKAEQIHDSFVERQVMRKVCELLDEMSLPLSKAKAISERFDDIDMLHEHPYMLCKVPGILFEAVDKYALKTGSNPNNPERMRAAILYAMEIIERNGHCFANTNQLMDTLMKIIKDVPPESFRWYINEAVKKDDIVFSCGVLYSKQAFYAETNAINSIIRIMDIKQRTNPPKIDAAYAKAAGNMKLDVHQIEGVKNAFYHPVTIITGGPGRGKTTIIKVLIDAFKELRRDPSIILCAPTGRAATRMSESCDMPASTIHSLLGLKGDEQDMDAGVTLDADLVIADEMSMCDIFLFNSFMSAIKPGTKVVIIGDRDQLPSVRCGNVFCDLIASEIVPTTFLTKIYRQADGSSIITNADKVNTGNVPLDYDKDTVLMPARGEEDIAWKVKQAVIEQSEFFSLDDIQILSPYRKKTKIGSNSLNAFLQDTFNPPSINKPELTFGFTKWRLGDRVMHIKNEDGLSNGDVGTINKVFIKTTEIQEKGIEVLFENGKTRFYEPLELNEVLVPACACTVHKSQGSQYKCVIIPFSPVFGTMRQRNLLYTAMTRAEKRVVIVGDEQSVEFAANNDKAMIRNSFLAARLVNEASKKGITQNKGQKRENVSNRQNSLFA